MVDYILCLLGIFVYFLSRYANRTKENSKLSITFWFKDNWPELVSSLLLNTALMIIIHLPETVIDLSPLFGNIPFGIKVAAIPTLSFLLGLGFTAAFYRMFKSKVEKKG